MTRTTKTFWSLLIVAATIGVAAFNLIAYYHTTPEWARSQAEAAQRERMASAQQGMFDRSITNLDSPVPQTREFALRYLSESSKDALPRLQRALARQDLTPRQRETLQRIVHLVPQRQREQAYRRRVEGETSHLLSSTQKVWTSPDRIVTQTAQPNLMQFARWSVRTIEGAGGEYDRAHLYAAVDRLSYWEEPLFSYIRATTLAQRGAPTPILAGLFQKAATQLRSSPYPAIWRCWADLDAARYADSADPAAKAEARRLMEEAIGLLPAALTEAQPNRAATVATIRKVAACSTNVLGDPHQLCDRAWPMLQKAGCDPSTILTARALVQKDSAWGDSDFASAIAPAGPTSSPTPLATAERLLEEAWAADSNNDIAACEMETLVAQRRGKPEELDKWFTRAMAANPDCYRACMIKLEYLKATCVNDPAPILAFGRECLQGGNWDAAIPLILVDAHILAAQCTPHGWDPGAIGDYFEQHPEACDEIDALYDEDKSHDPTIRLPRYAACRRAADALTGRWDKAAMAFLTDGSEDQPAPASYLPPGLLAVLHDEAGRRSGLNQP